MTWPADLARLDLVVRALRSPGPIPDRERAWLEQLMRPASTEESPGTGGAWSDDAEYAIMNIMSEVFPSRESEVSDLHAALAGTDPLTGSLRDAALNAAVAIRRHLLPSPP